MSDIFCMYIFFALVGFGLLALTSLFDKKLLSNRSRSIGAYTFFMSAFSVLAVVFFPWAGTVPVGSLNWLFIVGAAGGFFLGLVFLFQAIQAGEVSHAGPLVGAAVPFFTLIFSYYFLGEVLSDKQLAAIILLILGSLIISFEQSEQHIGWHRGMLFGLAAGLFFAGSHVLSKYLYGQLGFVTGIVWVRILLGLLGMSLLLRPSLRREIFGGNTVIASSGAKKYWPVLANMTLGVTGVVLVQYATALGSVSVVNSLEGFRYGLLIVLVALFSRFDAKFFAEKYARWEWLQEGVAILLIISGLILLI